MSGTITLGLDDISLFPESTVYSDAYGSTAEGDSQTWFGDVFGNVTDVMRDGLNVATDWLMIENQYEILKNGGNAVPYYPNMNQFPEMNIPAPTAPLPPPVASNQLINGVDNKWLFLGAVAALVVLAR